MLQKNGYFSYANCHEFANFMAIEFENANMPVSCELFYIKGGDHVFNVINRNPNSISRMPKTWGEECYIIDAWSGVIFKAEEFYKKMMNYNVVHLNDLRIAFLEKVSYMFHYPDKEQSDFNYSPKF